MRSGSLQTESPWLLLKVFLPEFIKDSIDKKDIASKYLATIKAKVDDSKKSQAYDLMGKLTKDRFDRVGSAREHILELVSLRNKIKSAGINFDDDFMVTITLNSLPESYKTLKTTYNALNNNWDIDELINVLTQEEGTINRTKVESANLT
ncbi:uncharacterized protein LOC122082157 [Macadamia integrifolia]|uniref:uncharacterized protein LOC122082157 n=1 Tax=Macadamia integrifolia TaxID=60698 RepID=UPI001C4E8501|nr:uncharacterized protein LOC122082157 [Macadamia integrifolia]